MKVSIWSLIFILILSLALCSCTKKEETQSPAKPVTGEAKSELTTMICSRCGGTGRCQACGGGGRTVSGTCYACDGSGRCFYCGGQGYY